MATGQTHGGKGSATRPTDKKKYEDNYDAIFSKKIEKPEILSSQLKTPDGTILESSHRHDCVTHKDANGKEYMLDGGCKYIRCSMNGDEEMLTVSTDAPHSVIREVVTWGTYGKNGDEDFKRVKIANMTVDHIKACLETQVANMLPALYKVMEYELEYRKALQAEASYRRQARTVGASVSSYICCKNCNEGLPCYFYPKKRNK